jgi:hypothetical protein
VPVPWAPPTAPAEAPNDVSERRLSLSSSQRRTNPTRALAPCKQRSALGGLGLGHAANRLYGAVSGMHTGDVQIEVTDQFNP